MSLRRTSFQVAQDRVLMADFCGGHEIPSICVSDRSMNAGGS